MRCAPVEMLSAKVHVFRDFAYHRLAISFPGSMVGSVVYVSQGRGVLTSLGRSASARA